MRRPRRLLLLVTAALATAPACSDDPAPPVPTKTLAEITMPLYITIGTGGDGVERLYVRGSGAAGCPTLDETLAISVDGVEIRDVFPGGPDDGFCDDPGGVVELAPGARPRVVRMYDASHEIVARLDARQVEPRRLTLTSHPSWDIDGGQPVTATVSHPEDFDRPVLDAYINAGSPGAKLDIEPAVDGDEIAFTMPAGFDTFDFGELRLTFAPVELAATACTGAPFCTFDWFPATYAQAIER